MSKTVRTKWKEIERYVQDNIDDDLMEFVKDIVEEFDYKGDPLEIELIVKNTLYNMLKK